MTLDYVDGNDPHNPRIGRYYNTIAKWETFAIDLTIACDLFRWFNLGQGAFVKNDGSKECRLYEIGNKVKHLPTSVNSGQCGTEETLPLWIDSAGLNSFGIIVSNNEAAEVLADVCTIADELQDPLTFVANSKAMAAGSNT